METPHITNKIQIRYSLSLLEMPQITDKILAYPGLDYLCTILVRTYLYTHTAHIFNVHLCEEGTPPGIIENPKLLSTGISLVGTRERVER